MPPVKKLFLADMDLLLSHAENLLFRFKNKALADTVERVGKDTKRKLSSNDRLIGAINLAEKHELACEYLCLGVAAGLHFKPESDESSKEVCAFAKEFGVKAALEKYCAYNGKSLPLIEKLYDMISNGATIESLVECCEEASGKAIRV